MQHVNVFLVILVIGMLILNYKDSWLKKNTEEPKKPNPVLLGSETSATTTPLVAEEIEVLNSIETETEEDKWSGLDSPTLHRRPNIRSEVVSLSSVNAGSTLDSSIDFVESYESIEEAENAFAMAMMENEDEDCVPIQ